LGLTFIAGLTNLLVTMRLPCAALLLVFFIAPAFLLADATIRYKNEMNSAAAIPSIPGNTGIVIYMKGNKGVTVANGSATIADFAKQEVTMIDNARKKYATIPVSQYGSQLEAIMPGDGAALLSSMKTTCESKKPGVTEVIQGVQTEERDVTCSTTMPVPDGAKQPAMSMKFVIKIWSALPIERMRVPALWELSGYELWQKYFMNPMGASSKSGMGGFMAPMLEAMGKDQSVALRTRMEMFMEMPSLVAAGAAASSTPFMKMSNEVVELSVAPLDDSLFAIPSEYSAASFGDVMNGLTAAAMASAKVPTGAGGASNVSIPANVKAYVPLLTPLTRTDPDAKDVQGMVEVLITVGQKGNVEGVEALGGPQELRKAAIDTVSQWTFRPVIRDGAPVSAYTVAPVVFIDRSKGPFGFLPDMAGEERKGQLAEAMPRSPQQVFADLEQDAGGGDKTRRSNLPGPLAMAALKAGANEKAGVYAAELLAGADSDKKGWNYGNAIHDGHTVLGLVALRRDDVAGAREQLLDAGKTPGSPQLNSFGPNMTLASELLKRGESGVVLDYFESCRAFWKMGGTQLDSWGAAVRKGETPFFGANLR